MSQRVSSLSLFKRFCRENLGKPSVKSASLESEEDPKPSELATARVNLTERSGEARTREPFNTLGRAVVRSEKLIELGNSWFSPK
jgi:hypothetical protein